jgi:hypothetical protein
MNSISTLDAEEALVLLKALVSSSVSQSVSHGGVTDELTNTESGGALVVHGRVVVPALVAQVVDRPIATITPLVRYGRVTVARVVPAAMVDPVLPLVIAPRTARYRQCYRRYWKALLHYISWAGFPGARRRLESATRRLVMQLPREGLTPDEIGFFRVWLEHGQLGDYEVGNGAGAVL